MPHKTSILQKTQEHAAVSHITNAMRVRIPTPITVILEDTVLIFLRNTQETAERFAMHKFKVAVTPFYRTGTVCTDKLNIRNFALG